MSVVKCFKHSESNCDCKEIESLSEYSLNNNDVVKKFENYRLKVEQIQAEYEEAKLVIDRLKEQINLFRDIENHNSIEIVSLRSQIKVLEEKRKSFVAVSEKQRSIEKALQKHDESIIEIKNVIQKIKENTQNEISRASKEMQLIKENRYFRSALQSKQEALEFVKNEMENALKEKEEYIARNNQLNEELENLKSEKEKAKDFCNKSVESYKKQINEYEAKIKQMEQERTRLLADYEVCAIPEANYESTINNFKQDQGIPKSPDRATTDERHRETTTTTTTRFLDERENISAGENICQKTSGHFSSQTQITRLNFSKDTDIQIKRNSFVEYLKKNTKYGCKQKPKIEFMNSYEPQMKRRLYSDNDNSYLN